METKWASLVSYGMTVEALTDFLPLAVTLDVQTVRHDTLKIAERCEAELRDEQWSFIEGCPRDWGMLPQSRMGRSPWALTAAMYGTGRPRNTTSR
jgi:hypothetical protein